MMEISEDSLFQSVKEIIRQSREKVFRIANSTLLLTYWQIGKLIVKDEQQGKGVGYMNLSSMRKFYTAFPIVDILSQQLSWPYYGFLLPNIVKKQFICQQISAVPPQRRKIKTNY